ncbi:hypothetical protein J437_LFUL010308 [Ladona fulva]|uniref:Uncharacterized protein n=1 Tax=Ladona fulva TaxID=123851 RepID=A0A8K0P5V9_LADFU|nr:hypothetical protein J437_LFUL010308 [Ladona fulva]
MEAHVNTCYKHFYYFVKEFDLVSSKELEPLQEMTARICRDSQPPPPQRQMQPRPAASDRPPLPPVHPSAQFSPADLPLCEPSTIPLATSSRGLR